MNNVLKKIALAVVAAPLFLSAPEANAETKICVDIRSALAEFYEGAAHGSIESLERGQENVFAGLRGDITVLLPPFQTDLQKTLDGVRAKINEAQEQRGQLRNMPLILKASPEMFRQIVGEAAAIHQTSDAMRQIDACPAQAK